MSRPTTIEEWRKTLGDLVEAIHRVMESDEHRGVYVSAHIHGVNVSPDNNFGKELRAAQDLLDASK